MNTRRFLAMLIVLALALTLLPLSAMTAMAYPATDVFNHPLSFTESTGIRSRVSFKMIYVEGGAFTLGWQIDNQYSSPPHSPFDTAPQQASVSDFYIAETETTQQLWDAVMTNSGTASTSTAPKSSVSFYEVNRFMGRLYVLTGKVYRLATEAEWEYAAKGGKPGKALGHDNYLYAGSNVESKVAVVTSGSNGNPSNVKSKEPNILGIYDMSGNIEEWVWNPWNSSIVGGDDPIGVNSPVHAQRTRRGGAHQGDSYTRMTTSRQIRSIDGGDPLLGFRIALSADMQSCPWEKAGLPKPFDIRHPIIDDRYEPNTYRDQRLVTNDVNVWDGDFVGIFGGTTMKLWDTGEAVLIPHAGGSAPIVGEWYSTLNCAIVIVPEEDNTDWQPNRHDGVRRLTITYTFMDPDMISVQNDRATVFAAPFGKLSRKNEVEYMSTLTPTGAHQGNYESIQKPTLKTTPTPTASLAPGVGPVAINHKKWDMTQMNDYGNIEVAAREKDPRIIDGPNECWWMGYGAGGQHTYRKDIDLDNYRFGVYSSAFGNQTNGPWGTQYSMNYICRGNWYTVNDVLLVSLGSGGAPQQHYIYNVAPDPLWQEKNEAQDPENTLVTYTKDNAEATNRKYVLARSEIMSPATYPFRHLSLQTQERGDQRLFFRWPTHEAQFYPDEIPTGNSSIFGSTFRTTPESVPLCPGVPVLNAQGGASGNFRTCGGTFYTCTCPIYPHNQPSETTLIDSVDLRMPNFEFGRTNSPELRQIVVVTPNVAASSTTNPFNPSLTAETSTAPGGTVARNTNYTVTIQIFPKTGYSFPATFATGAVTVNGVTATVNAANTSGNLSARQITVTLNSGLGKSVIQNIDLQTIAPSSQIASDTAARTPTIAAISGTSDAVSATAAFSAISPNLNAGNPYAPNTSYTLTYLLTPGATSSFPATLAELNVTVNGTPVPTSSLGFNGTAPTNGVAPNRTVAVAYPVTGPALEVTDVELSMMAPAAGLINNAAARAITVVSGDVTASAAATPWTTPPATASSVAADGAFALGTAYGFTFTLAPGIGRAFPAELGDLHVKVNGGDAVVTGASGANRTVFVAFPATAAAPVVSAVALEMPLPAWGKSNDAAARTMTIISGAATYTNTTTPFSVPPSASTSPASGSAFARDTVYSYTFTLAPQAGYAFPETLGDLAVTVNGSPATVSAATGTVNRTVTFTFPSSGRGNIVSSVSLTATAPVTGAQNNANNRAMTVVAGDTVATVPTLGNTPWTVPPSNNTTPANNGNFAAETAYRLTFTLNAGSASTFPDWDANNPDALTVKVNGISAVVTGATGTWNRTVYVDFPATAPAPAVQQQAQTLFADNINRLTTDTGTVALGGFVASSAGSNGGTITYAIEDRGTTNATLSGANLTSGNARGQVVVRASTPGNANYAAAEKTFLVTVTTPAYTITFNANGGSAVSPATAQTQAFKGDLANNGKLASLPATAHEALDFDGWFTSGGNMVTTDYAFSSSQTIYAQWSEPGSPPVINIVAQPAPASVIVGQISSSLSIAAIVTKGGTPAYAWYQSADAIASPASDMLLGTATSVAIPAGLALGTYYFYCVVTADDATDVVSDVVAVSVIPVPPPEITILTQPAASTVVAEGAISGNLSVAATVTKNATLSYQWFSSTSGSIADGSPISGAMSRIFAIPSDLQEGIYYYYCEVGASDEAVPVASNVATVTVMPFGTQLTAYNLVNVITPGKQYVIVASVGGASYALTPTARSSNLAAEAVTVSGTQVIDDEKFVEATMLWTITDAATAGKYKISIGTSNLNRVSAATSTLNTVTTTGANNEWNYDAANNRIYNSGTQGSYYLQYNAGGYIQPTTAGSTVNASTIYLYELSTGGTPPAPVVTIGTQPAPSSSVTQGSIGGSLSVSASVTMGGTPSYAWYQRVGAANNPAIDLAIGTSAAVAIPTGLTAGTYYFYCVVSASGAASVTSSVATVVVAPPPVPVITIDEQPAASMTFTVGAVSGSLSVSASATLSANVSYAWHQCDGAAPAPATDSVVGSGASFAIPSTLAAGTYRYYCVVSALGAASVASSVAVVTVEAPAVIPVTSITIVNAAGVPVPATVTTARNSSTQFGVTFNKGASAAVVWVSSDQTVATVSQSGLVTTRNKAGIAVITARDSASGCSATFVIRVN